MKKWILRIGIATVCMVLIALGHNRHVEWRVTNVMVDDVDFFIEKINPDNPHQYFYKGKEN